MDIGKIVLSYFIVTSFLLAKSSTFELGQIEVISEADIAQNRTISVLEEEDIKNSESKNLVDALIRLPGVIVDHRGDKNQMDIRIRGFRQAHIPIFIDGIPIYVPYNRETDLGRYTTYDVSKITVSKGYTSPMYGANTIGGAVNIITKKPTKPFEGSVGAGVFSGDGHEEFINLGTNQGSYYGMLSLSNYQRDYFKLSKDFDSTNRQNGRKRVNSDFKDRKVNLKVGYTPNETDEYSFNYIVQRATKGQPVPTQGELFRDKRYWRWPDWDKTSYYLITKTAIGEHFLKTRWYYDKFYNKMLDYKDGTFTELNTPKAGDFNPSEYDDHSYGGAIEGDFSLSANHQLKLFISQKNDYHDQKRGKEESDAITQSIGTEYAWRLSDKLNWVLGASYDYFKVKKSLTKNGEAYDSNPTMHAFNPQTALYYQIDEDLMVFGSISRKSNMPSLHTLYSTKFNSHVPNPDLNPEISTNYEVGLEYKIASAHMLKSSLFFNQTKDFLGTISVAPSGSCVKDCEKTINIGKYEHIGVEVEIDSYWSSYLATRVGFMHIEPTIKNPSDAKREKYVKDTPRNSLAASLIYNPIHSIDIMPSLRYESKRYYDNENGKTNNSFTLVDFKVAYRPIRDLEFSTGVKNIFDKYYYYDIRFPQEGRQFYANVRYQF